MATGRLGGAVGGAAGLEGRVGALPYLTFPKLHVLVKEHLVLLDLLQHPQHLRPHGTALQQVIVLCRVSLQVKE